MSLQMIICPRCGGHSPSDALFCIDCSAPLQVAATSTTRLLNVTPAAASIAPRQYHAWCISPAQVIAGTLLLAPLVMLLLLGYGPNATIDQDSIAALLVLIGCVQLVRFTRQGKFTLGLRAVVICLALVVMGETPWMLTSCAITGATLAILHISEIVGKHFHRHRP